MLWCSGKVGIGCLPLCLSSRTFPPHLPISALQRCLMRHLCRVISYSFNNLRSQEKIDAAIFVVVRTEQICSTTKVLLLAKL